MSDCYCYDGPTPEFYTNNRQRSRKARKCYECGTEIAKGDFYWRATGKWDGDFSSFATCEPCNDLIKRCDFFCLGHGGIREGAWYAEFDHDMEVLAYRRRAEQSEKNKLQPAT